jgi:large subunit ribosomal protein L21
MYVIFESGGKQYQAEPGAVVKVEKLPGEPGDQVVIEKVLLVSDGTTVTVGRPRVAAAAVLGRIVEQGRHRKIVVFKHKRRKDYRKKQGHRQAYTALLIEEIRSQAEPAQEVASS